MFISIISKCGLNDGCLMKVGEKTLLVSWTQWLINCSIILVEKKLTMYGVKSIFLSLLCYFSSCLISNV